MSEFLRAITPGALGTLQALLVGVAVVFGLLVGFCVLLSVPKLRPSGRQSKTVRGLDELVGVRRDVPRRHRPARPGRSAPHAGTSRSRRP